MEQTDRKIHQLDATDIPLGRLATKIAILLRGKNKASFDPARDEGDFVEVSNCQAVKFTGKKLDQKDYKWHTTHPGGLKSVRVRDVFAKNPSEVLKVAVWGMLPKNKLRDRMIKRLRFIK